MKSIRKKKAGILGFKANKIFNRNNNKDAKKPELKFELRSEREKYLQVFLYEFAIKNEIILLKINKANKV